MIHKASYFSRLTLGTAAAALLVAGVITACNQEKTADKPAASTTGTSTAAATEGKEQTVYVNQDSLMAKYDYVKDMTERLDKKGKNVQGQVASRRQAIQREVAEYQKNAQTMSAEQRAPIEQRLQRKGMEQQTYEENAAAQFQSDQGEENEKLYKKVMEFTKKYAKEKGYKFILTTSRANTTVLYGEPGLDVTADFVKGLNEEYAKEKK